MAASLIDDCKFYGAELHAFVVMTHHIHFIARVPAGRTSPWLMQRIKSNSARRILPKLDAQTLSEFDQQRGLDGRSFWQRRFRSYIIRDVFWQKVKYIHENPVRAGLCAAPEDYSWSSAHLFLEGRWDEEHGLDLEGLAERFADRKDLEFGCCTLPTTRGEG